MDKVDPFVAHYCRMHALQQALGVERTAEVKQFLNAMLPFLEASKAALPKHTRDEAHKRVLAFALMVFKQADDSDMATPAEQLKRKHALAYKAASTFFEVASQFGEMDDGTKNMYTFAKQRAVKISKCLSSGETPPAREAPPPQSQDEEAEYNAMVAELEEGDVPDSGASASAAGAGAASTASSASASSAPAASDSSIWEDFEKKKQKQERESSPPNTAPSTGVDSASQFTFTNDDVAAQLPSPPANTNAATGNNGNSSSSSSNSNTPSGTPHGGVNLYQPVDPFAAAPPPAAAAVAERAGAIVITASQKFATDQIRAIVEGEKLAKHAASALRFDDVQGAIEKMKEAIAVLMPHQ
eukprot:TRINITY_DN8239_c0_g1_i1.p1 TRINITY_DN8239_c0_g1~~TRINITY_DN8239_c0_g1_i1.p1  ORF type:complete len:389 (+),score=180.89 TRINITY_DN8239_c0_g1_i1:100-1167(+)